MQKNRQRTLIGMLTPSSNTALEPITTMMLAGLTEVTAHFGRFRVKTIALSDTALSQFDDANILAAADLLADAELDAIAWNGTSSSWLGFESDEKLCARIHERKLIRDPGRQPAHQRETILGHLRDGIVSSLERA